jgi:hypothetical protein
MTIRGFEQELAQAKYYDLYRSVQIERLSQMVLRFKSSFYSQLVANLGQVLIRAGQLLQSKSEINVALHKALD